MPDKVRNRLGWSGLALVGGLLLLTAVLGCIPPETGEHEKTAVDGTPGKELTQTVPGPGFDPTEDDRALIAANVMHQTHISEGQVACNACHTNRRSIPHQEAHLQCQQCHDNGIVADQVWRSHCLSCHHLSESAATYAGNNGILYDLCVECHGDDQVVHPSFNADSEHDISCDNCHNPHETTLVFGGKLCLTCHQDKTEIGESGMRVHGSCLVCHTPHSGIDEIEIWCTKCHYASNEILIHNVPDHPKNCLACHSAHFTSTSIEEQSCLACHDDTYYGGSSHLPAAHRDCVNCHYAGNFAFRGTAACTACHKPEGTVVTQAGLPEEHANCGTCHKPHRWYSSFEQNCEQCHDLSAVIEHNLSFHQHECNTCHEPHSTATMVKTGDCSGCHQSPAYPDFQPGTIDEHLQCVNCHDQVAIDSRRFTFAGPSGSCMVCHFEADPLQGISWQDVPFGHRVCNICHSAHRFEVAGHSDSCDLCHVDIYATAPPSEHTECFNCHAMLGHTMPVSGQDDSCSICHAGIPVELAVNGSHPRECAVCHSVHGAGQPLAACRMCHSELNGLHQTPMAYPDGSTRGCMTCHSTHGFSTGNSTCAQCHDDEHTTAEPECLDCHFFNADGG